VLPILIHLEDVPPDPIRRLAALGGAEVADRLRLSRAERTRLETLDRDSLAATPAAELGYRLGAETAWDALLLRAARLEEPLPDDAKAAVAQGAAARFPLVAADLMPRFQGADLGRKLAALEARWIASGFTMSKDELLENP
jgi:poly(A) polymerase